ncbi:hypothetical protein AGOR_G00250690 [Albula goreensis]|uniref:Adenosine receptor A2 n=1 Tax=Albula goreensis TaxID=1534307 RepID=A0A8T3CCB6_9TELE|nr:hypothetical protein AGOR_G00250690 [Albula goreensis]
MLSPGYVALELAMAVMAVVGNVLVCWAVWLNSSLQSITNLFVVSLAVADIAVGLLGVPFAVTISVGFCAMSHGCLFIACFVLVLTQGSIFSLLAIAVDRYIAIRNPLRYNSLVTCQRAKGTIAICWTLSVLIGLMPMLGWNRCGGDGANTTSPCPPGTTQCLFEGVVTMEYMVYFNFFACVLPPLVAMLGIYTCIFMAARRQLRLMGVKVWSGAGSVQGPGSRSTLLQRELHAAVSLAIIVGLFAACWLPLHIINCFTLFCPACQRPPDPIMYLAIVLSHANSAINPFVYAYRVREFRLTFRRIVGRCCGGLGWGGAGKGSAPPSTRITAPDATMTLDEEDEEEEEDDNVSATEGTLDLQDEEKPDANCDGRHPSIQLAVVPLTTAPAR